jgi:DNA (cytosine-5)-methyltransferase 1
VGNFSFKHGSLFSGIGGFDLAAEWMGWENIFHCEWNEFGQKILNHYWPNAISYGDITKTNFTIHRGAIDVLTGGFPCQPYSVAGKRKGKEDERHLWPEMLRAIREISPTFIVGENVHGIVNWNGGLVFHEVQTDLENEGYEILPVILPACAVGAPHRRDRIWFVAANYDSERCKRNKEFEEKFKHNGRRKAFGEFNSHVSPGIIANSNIGRFKECWPKWFTSREFTQNYGFTSEPGICRGDDGFPYRVDRLKALGNAIVPQVALQIFKAIQTAAIADEARGQKIFNYGQFAQT